MLALLATNGCARAVSPFGPFGNDASGRDAFVIDAVQSSDVPFVDGVLGRDAFANDAVQSSDVPFAPDVPSASCVAADCVDCTHNAECGWCGRLGVCRAGTANGPDDHSCSTDDWAWTLDRCGAPAACPIEGTYRTDGVPVVLLDLHGGAYRASGDVANSTDWTGAYVWDGATLTFAPISGPPGDCASAHGSSVRVRFSADCSAATVMVVTDACTGGGLLTRTHMLFRR
jgi:hypothetical protein